MLKKKNTDLTSRPPEDYITVWLYPNSMMSSFSTVVLVLDLVFNSSLCFYLHTSYFCIDPIFSFTSRPSAIPRWHATQQTTENKHHPTALNDRWDVNTDRSGAPGFTAIALKKSQRSLKSAWMMSANITKRNLNVSV